MAKQATTADDFFKQYTPECVAEDMICSIINGDKDGAASALNFLQQKGEGEKDEDKEKDKKPAKK